MVTNVSAVRRWSMLVIALGSTMCANVFINGAAFLIPTLHGERGLDLSRAGLVSAMPSFGMVLTLIAWGWVVDRVGERFVLTVGSLLTSAAAFAAAWADSLVAVGAFLKGGIRFLDIYDIIEETMLKRECILEPTLDELFAEDRWAREFAASLLEK